jgi:small-conductance mechanosensitive channel
MDGTGSRMWDILANGQQWIVSFGLLLAAAGAGLVVHFVLVRVLVILARRTASKVDDLLIDHLRNPSRWVLILAAVHLTAASILIPAGLGGFLRHILSILLILAIAWLLIRAASVLGEIVHLRFEVSVPDNLRARVVSTQINVLRRIIVAAIIAIALATILMTFDQVRQLGAAVLASAGIAGIILGLAAQRTLGNLIAGLQIAFTQPLRIDDVVIVEGEWGRIEEITLTYVVVRIWDLRRLIVPITYFVETPFQNWTRTSAEILGTVFLHVDYTVPVDAVRAELRRILENTKLWDRKVGLIQVTNASERTIELRALMSAPDAGTAWDLRCHVREKLIEFVQRNYPEALPRLRTQFEESQNRDSDDA